jgi:hypothetical protein
MSNRAILSILVVLTSVVALPSVAHATAGFPGEIQSHLSLASAPDCSLCHTDGSTGGKGTVNTPFGKSIRAHGLVAYDTGALDSALDAEAKDGTDSDGDGSPDITELKAGTDPNVSNGVGGGDAGLSGGSPAATSVVEPPQYGCALGARTNLGAESTAGLSVLVLGMAHITRRRRRPS